MDQWGQDLECREITMAIMSKERGGDLFIDRLHFYFQLLLEIFSAKLGGTVRMEQLKFSQHKGEHK